MELPVPSRRQILRMSGLGIGDLAFTWMLEAEAPKAEALNLRARPSHFPAKARAVIQLVQTGGPSQMDLFDPKPELQKRHGQRHVEKTEMFQRGSEANELMAAPFEFQRYGQSGIHLSEVLTHTRTLVDDVAFVRSMYTEHNNHTEGLVMLVTGKIFPGRPTLGAWVSYALGTENQNLPAYVVLRDPEGYSTSGNLLWDNGWIPAIYRGTEFSTSGSPVLNLTPAIPVAPETQQRRRDLLSRLNEEHRQRYPLDTELEVRIRNHELAARMQLASSTVLDVSKESAATRKLYGLDNSVTAGYGMRCLMARRLVESGVRFVQVFPPVKPSNQPWDTHNKTREELTRICGKTELPVAGLINDLKSRGLLDSTIVLWAGEFGRQPVSQNGSGRDHNRHAFTVWLAGGGFRKGLVYGATDDFGYRSVDQRVSVPSLHATILHQLGLDHRKLTFVHHGRPETLTDSPLTGAHVVSGLIDSAVKA